MKILITGGAGYIGSHTCYLLLKRGYEIIVFDSFINSSFSSLKRVKRILINEKIDFQDFKIINGDIRDEKLLDKVFKDEIISGKPIESVIHFAGLKSVQESVESPIEYWECNVGGTLNLIKAMENNNCKSLIFSSSATIYNSSDYFKFKENSPIKPISPYGQTKATVEKLLFDLHKSDMKKWKIINLRYFNPIGAHESGMIGENPLNKPNNLFPLMNLAARGIIDELKIYGNDWPTNDGTAIRDYIHVMDLAEGHISALSFLINDQKTKFESINLGTGLGTSVLELVKTFMRVNKVKIPYSFTNRRPGDSCFLVADNSKSLTILNWLPKRNIEDMCKDGWKWSFLNPEGYK